MNKLERLREIERRYISLTSGCQWGDTCQCHQQLDNVRKEIKALEVEAQAVRGRESVRCPIVLDTDRDCVI